MASDDEPLIVAEAAQFARRHPETIRKALAVGDLHGEQRMRKGVWLIERECIRAYLRNELCEHRRSNVRDITTARSRRGA